MDSSDEDIESKEDELFELEKAECISVHNIILVIEKEVDRCRTASGVLKLRNRLDTIADRVLETDWDKFNVSRGLVDPLYVHWMRCCQRIGKARDALGKIEFKIYQYTHPPP